MVSGIDEAQYSTKLVTISFLYPGLDGIMKATLSYEPAAVQGHIWMVDKENDRDCKGQWFLNRNKNYQWEIKCTDQLSASGTLTNPLDKSGSGRGRDNLKNRINFIFSEAKPNH